MKVGMVSLWDSWGVKQNLTVLHLDDCQVVQVKTTENGHNYTAMQLGVGAAKVKNVTKPLRHHYLKAGVLPKRKLDEFRVTEDALLPVGTQLNAQHFVAGQHLDISGTSVGKGFQGVMKRHNFKGQRATHGVSKTHRHAGSTGQCQDPGRVFKGKKMAGRMGGKRVTNRNLWLYKVDPVQNLLFVKGSVPGKPGTFVRVSDARKTSFDDKQSLPFPTFVTEPGEDILEQIIAPPQKADPLNYMAES